MEACIGLAGGDREASGNRIRAEVTKFLGQGPDMTLSVTNDIEMLATTSSHRFQSDDVIVLVAGTGSIAMRYRREGNVMRRVARAGKNPLGIMRGEICGRTPKRPQLARLVGDSLLSC
jgi:N-acetylmuramic acid 6-phosphate etherase